MSSGDKNKQQDEKDQNDGPQHCPHLLFRLLARKVRAMGDAALARLQLGRAWNANAPRPKPRGVPAEDGRGVSP